ncbi:cardiolipin synthase-like protein [Paraphysoderma sedebokerense]|nr:cardiolipin synthase-like protein [Paraphysoderma sedebokerense]
MSISHSAKTLCENLYTIPNLLTFSRLVASPFLGYFVTAGHYEAALGLFAFASATDLLDGYIARRYNMQSFVGSIIDPLADKVLMTTLTISLGYVELIPVPLAALILGRDAGLILASFYYRYISLPPPKTLTRYFDFSLPSAEVHPTLVSKINTALQLGLMGAALSSPVFEFVGHPGLLWLQGLVGITTVWSGLSYVWSKNAVRILDRKEVLKKLKDRIRKD